MAASHGRHTYIEIEDPDNLGTFINVSTKAHNVRLPMTRQDVDTTTFGNNGDMTNIPGMRDGNASFDVYNDATINAILYKVWQLDAPLRVRYGPTGNGTGAERFTAYFNLTNWEPGGSVTTANAASASFHRTGATTYDTWA